jgi:hypothetical protein
MGTNENTPVTATGAAATEMVLVLRLYSVGVDGEGAASTGMATGYRGRQTIEQVADVNATPLAASR